VFEGLIDRFQIIRRKVLGYGRITKSELQIIIKDIRITLLEADVNYKVVKKFVAELNEKCAKLELTKSLTPGDLIIKAVYEELVTLLGTNPEHIEFKKGRISVISLIGLQGVGKTTTAVKLGIKYKGKNPLLVPADIKRPAAFQQLNQLAQRAQLAVCPLDSKSAVQTTGKALRRAQDKNHGLIIIDTAGRLHIDDALIEELVEINRVATPDYRLLVADGMSGQDAVNQAVAFKEKVGLDGAILTKLDGDTRGGAALSIKWATNMPIFFVGTGETLDGIEEFYPDRMAQRIMGMGDVASLVEKVKTIEGEIDQKRLQNKVLKGELNFEDFLKQLKTVKKLGPIAKLAAMMPGIKEADVNESDMKKIEAIISSMTKEERLNPDIIDGSRKRRIAAGSGTTTRDVNQLLRQFSYARDLLKKIGKGKVPGGIPFRM
jgi:signal recognition particle subunit SRP54